MKQKYFFATVFTVASGLVLALHDYAILQPQAAWEFTEKTPFSDSKGLFQLGYLQFGKGRVVVSGEAAMFF